MGEDEGKAPFGSVDLEVLGERLRMERQRRRMSMDEVAEASGVGRSTVSEIERAVRAPSVVVLDRVAGALGLTLWRLLAEGVAGKMEVVRVGEQPAGSGDAGARWLEISPGPLGGSVGLGPGKKRGGGITRASLPAWAEGVEVPPARGPAGTRGCAVVERGVLAVQAGGAVRVLGEGDALFYEAGGPAPLFSNPGEEPCIFYLVLATNS